MLRHVRELEEKGTSEDLYNSLSLREREVFKHLPKG